jgi:hypothetical protein
VVGGLVVVVAQLAFRPIDGVLPLQVVSALGLVLHQEPGEELDAGGGGFHTKRAKGQGVGEAVDMSVR